MQDIIDALERGVPAVVGGEVGDREAQPAARASSVGHGRHSVGDGLLPARLPHRGAHLVAAPQELGDAPAGDIAAAPGDQNQLGHDRPPRVSQ